MSHSHKSSSERKPRTAALLIFYFGSLMASVIAPIAIIVGAVEGIRNQ